MEKRDALPISQGDQEMGGRPGRMNNIKSSGLNQGGEPVHILDKINYGSGWRSPRQFQQSDLPGYLPGKSTLSGSHHSQIHPHRQFSPDHSRGVLSLPIPTM
jgi:hypothetical protein